MITLARQEFDKMFLKSERYEIYSAEQFDNFIENNMEVLQKGEKDELTEEIEKSEYETLKEEIRSFTPIEVISESQESKFRIEKSICYVREKQVEWDEPELIKGEDGEEIEKARGGTYGNTPLNRKLGRVGQRYGKSSMDEDKKEGGKKEDDHLLLKKMLGEKMYNLTSDEKKEELINKIKNYKNYKGLSERLDKTPEQYRSEQKHSDKSVRMDK